MENSEPQADPYDIWKALQPQVVIVNNPMYFVKLKRETRSKLVAFFEYFKTFTERWFSHILLLFVLFLYGCFGAWIFMMIEGKAEVKYKVSQQLATINRLKQPINQKLKVSRPQQLFVFIFFQHCH